MADEDGGFARFFVGRNGEVNDDVVAWFEIFPGDLLGLICRGQNTFAANVGHRVLLRSVSRRHFYVVLARGRKRRNLSDFPHKRVGDNEATHQWPLLTFGVEGGGENWWNGGGG